MQAGAWIFVASVLAVAATGGWLIPHVVIDWQPGLVATQPWRAFTAIGVHYSALHLGGNLGGAALAGAFGWAAQVPPRLALAWLAAWPLTHLGLLVEPRLLHYGGLSGVLHAGAAVVLAQLLVHGSKAQRCVGAALALGLVAKLVSEAPWGSALRYTADWDIATAPIAHTTGAVAGAVCGAVALALRPRGREVR